MIPFPDQIWNKVYGLCSVINGIMLRITKGILGKQFFFFLELHETIAVQILRFQIFKRGTSIELHIFKREMSTSVTS